MMLKTTGTKNNVATVAKIKPPITARPSGAFCSPPSPRPSDIGNMPMIIASAVISTGRSRVRPASKGGAGGAGGAPSLPLVVGEGAEQNRVRRGGPDRHGGAHQTRHPEGRPPQEEHPH